MGVAREGPGPPSYDATDDKNVTIKPIVSSVSLVFFAYSTC